MVLWHFCLPLHGVPPPPPEGAPGVGPQVHGDLGEGIGGSGFMMVNVTMDMSGVYTCKVSTNAEERIWRKRVTVYSKYGLYLQGFY